MKMPPTEPNDIHFSTWAQNDLIKSPNYLVEYPPWRQHQKQKIWRVIHFELGAHWALHPVLDLKKKKRIKKIGKYVFFLKIPICISDEK